MTEAKWGGDDEEKYIEWRNEYVEKAREWSGGNISSFFNNRLTFQRGTRGLEKEDHSPWKNPEASLMDTFLVARTEEGDLWTEEESFKIRKIMGSFVSISYSELLAANPRHWTQSVWINQYFENNNDIVLEDDEFDALEAVLGRVGKSIDPNIRSFTKPDIPTTD